MSKITRIILSVMLILAVGCTCFNVGSKHNLVTVLQDTVAPFTDIGQYGLRVINRMFGEPLFLASDDVLVVRLYFRDGTYCDVARYNTPFANEVFAYSNNPAVVSYSSGVLLSFRKFYDEKGNVLYEQSWTQEPATLQTTWGDYLLNYQQYGYKEGWSIDNSYGR